MTLFGIGDKFTFERRSWIVKDIINQNWICETIDKKEKRSHKFTKNDMIKITARS
jgi:hypothetical protein